MRLETIIHTIPHIDRIDIISMKNL